MPANFAWPTGAEIGRFLPEIILTLAGTLLMLLDAVLIAGGQPGGGREPPCRVFPQQLAGAAANGCAGTRTRDLLVATEDEHGRPLGAADDLLDLEAHARILAHPADLLAERGKPVDEILVRIEIERHRHDIRLVAAHAREPAVSGTGQHDPAFDGIQTVNEHT